MLLDVKNIDVLYDEFQVIWDISINVNKGEMVALLGPNGSGKSTILNTISNLVHHRNGSIHFENNLISETPTHKRTELGISHVLERRRVFPHLTVMQNLLLGAWHPKAKEQLDNSLSKIYKIFPKLLMVDEPFLGLSPMVMKDLIKIFKNIVNEGISILFVEQNVRLALSMADRGYVLESGRLVIDGKSSDLIDNEKVTKVFLGN